MSQGPMPEQFIRHVNSLKLKFPVASLARKTKESKGNISDFLNGNKNPSDNFLKKFYDLFPNGFKDEQTSDEPEPETITAEKEPEYTSVYIQEIAGYKERVVLLREVIAEKNKTISDRDKTIDDLRKIIDGLSNIDKGGETGQNNASM